jgi:hypothetical protein
MDSLGGKYGESGVQCEILGTIVFDSQKLILSTIDQSGFVNWSICCPAVSGESVSSVELFPAHAPDLVLSTNLFDTLL